MSISYKKLFKLLIDKDIKAKKLVDDSVLSRSTMLKIKNSEYVSLEIIEKICVYLKCPISDILEIKESNNK